MPRSKKSFVKRKFHGNRYTKQKKNDEESESRPNLQTPRGGSCESVNSGSCENVNKPSCSKRKLYLGPRDVGLNNEHIVNNEHIGNIIISVDILSNFIKKNTCCKYCKSSGTLYIEENVESRLGLCTELIMKCTKCDKKCSTRTSETTRHRFYDINVRLVYGMRCIGKGKKGADLLCGILNLPPPMSKFSNYTDFMKRSLVAVSQGSMIKAASEIIAESGTRDIIVGIDGTWQRRGYVSHNGVVAAASPTTGKIIDIEVLSNHCTGCNLKKPNHKCTKNYEGTSGGMESEGAKRMFLRSMGERGVRYTKYLGDGDSKGYKVVCDSKPYGENIAVEKLECIGHVQKRLGSRLRKLKKDMSGKKLSDGRGLGGAGRLTDAEIDLLQRYYGLAIRRNCNNVEDMKKAVWSSYFHKLSTDKKSQHELCPKGADSWCGYQKAKISGEAYSHKHSLPSAVLLAIKPIYKDLTDVNLLRKCLHGYTQNVNESYNNCVWERIPKTVFVNSDTLLIGACDAVLTFNDGAIARTLVLNDMGLKYGVNTREALSRIDKTRVYHAQRAAQSASKDARTKRRQAEKRKRQEEEDADDYGPGIH